MSTKVFKVLLDIASHNSPHIQDIENVYDMIDSEDRQIVNIIKLEYKDTSRELLFVTKPKSRVVKRNG